MATLIYDHDIILTNISIKGLNLMLNIYSKFVIESQILYNCKKSACIKYVCKEKERELVKIDRGSIKMVKFVN